MRLFNWLVVTTEFSTVWHQMEHMKNDIVTDFEPEYVADAIDSMMVDQDLYQSIHDS